MIGLRGERFTLAKDSVQGGDGKFRWEGRVQQRDELERCWEKSHQEKGGARGPVGGGGGAGEEEREAEEGQVPCTGLMAVRSWRCLQVRGSPWYEGRSTGRVPRQAPLDPLLALSSGSHRYTGNTYCPSGLWWRFRMMYEQCWALLWVELFSLKNPYDGSRKLQDLIMWAYLQMQSLQM